VNADELRPHRHEPPPGWPPEVFAAVTDALAAAIIAGWRRSQREDATAVTEAGPEPA
jgi:hypothetical protein